MIGVLYKWYKLVKFIRKHRKRGFASFSIVTTSDEIIVVVEELGGPEGKYVYEQIRLNYYGY